MKASARSLLSIFALLFASVTSGHAETDRGLEIARTMRQEARGYGDYTADMKMTLIDAKGNESLRQLRVKVREVAGDGEQSLAIFDTPADVSGIAFLSHTHILAVAHTRTLAADDQWLYLPSLKRVKRISPANKTSPFIGSEFSYEDLASPEVEKYTYKYVGDGVFENRPTHLLERYPVDENSGYSRQLVWVDQERHVALRIEYYDRNGVKLKTLYSRGFKQYLDRYWQPSEMFMENHQSGKRSVLIWSNYRYRQGLSAQDFNPSSLTRIR